MTWKAFGFSVLLAVVWTAAALFTVCKLNGPAPQPRFFVVDTGKDQYKIDADDAITDGFCTIFIRHGVRIAGACGTHTWSEAREVE